jgi:hypothetical protein
MTRAQVEHIFWLIDRIEGTYYGNKRQFAARQSDLIVRLIRGLDSNPGEKHGS